MPKIKTGFFSAVDAGLAPFLQKIMRKREIDLKFSIVLLRRIALINPDRLL